MPELEVLSNFTSVSKIKSPYSFSVTKKELGLLATVMPCISPFFTWYLAVPPNCFQPLKSFPLNRDCHCWPNTLLTNNKPVMVKILFIYNRCLFYFYIVLIQ